LTHSLLGSLRLPLACFGLVFLIACSDSSDRNDPVEPPVEPPEPELTYSAEIVWTEYGIPHVTADDWGSLGYGLGYAYANENYCTLMREYVRANGESARYLGDEGDLNADLVYALFNTDERMDRLFDALPEYIQNNLIGYTAGVNRYLNETGADNLAEGEEGCRGAQWVREVDYMDSMRLIHKAVLIGSSGPLADFTVAAQTPEMTAMSGQKHAPEQVDLMLAKLDQKQVDAAMAMPQGSEIGSNAYAVGEETSQTNSGILFGNPHFPWHGIQRFFAFHVTLGDEYDVMGAALGGLPAPVIGFNENLAWSHTVSTGSRFTFYELTLNPDNIMEYEYDGEMREITSETVSVVDASGENVEHTFYFSHFGPIVDLGDVSPLLGGWPNAAGTLLTYRDANMDNVRGLEQWINMGKAQDLGEFKEALRSLGTPWVNTIAADRYGDAFYGDISVVPNVSIAQYGSCIRGTLQTLLTDFGFVTMDGSDPDCEWGNDDGTAEGIFGYESLPKLETREYAANANDSYWLSNPRQLLQGFSPLIGQEAIEQSKRTRHTFDMAERRLVGQDGLGEAGFNIDNIREMSYQATNHVAELILKDVVDICSEVQDWSEFTDDPDNALLACEVLGDWDGSHRVDSIGGHVFYEFWNDVKALEDAEGDAYLWSVPFKISQPVGTPVSLSLASEVVSGVRQSLANAADKLKAGGIALDLPWGEVQFDEKNGVRYGIHGGSGSMMFSVITSDLVDGEGYSAIRHGNSYMQAITWDETDCPDAYAMVTYSQSTDPASDHYADATELYSKGGWIDMPFCEAARDEQEIGRITLEE
jgi:acyl-homoserine-lactone acylase